MKLTRITPLLFLSGAGALVLEVCWFRRMAQVAGATSIAMSAVLAAVIGGMAAGSFWVGRRADRSRNPLKLYGVLEAGVALFAVLTPWLLTASEGGFDALQRHFGETPFVSTPLRFLLATALLTPPAILMGGTLPAAACALRAAPAQRGRALGWLYAANTLGAVAGTFAAGFWLIPWLGQAGAMRSAVLPTALVALIATRARAGRADADADAPAATPVAPARRAIMLYAVSGFLGLTAEVAFTRSLVLVFGSTTYAFTTMLGIFLLGIGLGGGIGARLARRADGHLRLLENTVVLTAALFSVSALLVFLTPRLYLMGFVGGGEGIWLRVALSALILLPGALGLGVAFPLAAHLASAGAVGAGTGRLYAANTFASVVGSTAAVFVFVPWLGPQHTVAAAAIATAAYVLMGTRRVTVCAFAVAAAAGFWPVPDVARERLLSGVYFAPAGWLRDGRIDEDAWAAGVDLPYVDYGREATVAVWRWYGTNSVLIDGKAVATNQVLADDHHLALLGHVPLAVHADPQRVLIVGLGLGTTYRAVRQHGPRLVRVVELEEAVIGAAAYVGTKPDDIVVADARTYLRSTRETFDVVTSDPIHPWVRGGGDLYTVEYFESCKARLAPGGVACQWLPVYQMHPRDVKDIVRTFCRVFRAAAYYGGGDLVLVGVAEGDVPAPRPMAGAVQTSLGNLGADHLQDLLVAGHDRLVARAGDGPLLTDDALRLEFSTPGAMENTYLGECLRWVVGTWGEPPKPYGQILDGLIAGAEGREGFWHALRRARQQAPDNRYVTRLYGEAYLMAADDGIRNGNLDAAAKDLAWAARFLAGDPRLPGIEADLLAARGDWAGALALYRQLAARYPDSRFLARRVEHAERNR